jgi:hypothetical protein
LSRLDTAAHPRAGGPSGFAKVDMLPGLTGFRDGQSSLRETRSQQGPCDCPGSVQQGMGGRQLRIFTAVAVFRRMNRQIEPFGGSTVCLGVPCVRFFSPDEPPCL